MKELWKDILGYEGFYQISNLGEVKSMPKYCGNRPTKEKLCSQDCRRGYKSVGLCKNSVLRHKQVHRLVAEAFIPNPEKKPEVNHKNGIKTDNRVENLEWVSHQENLNHARNILGKKNAHPARKVIQIKNNTIITIFDSVLEAKNKTFINNISGCCRGTLKTAGGYKWKYIE